MYQAFKDEDSGESYGSFEVFYQTQQAVALMNEGRETWDDHKYEPGWYWWACFPGCLPDGDPSGPFATEDEALSNAQDA